MACLLALTIHTALNGPVSFGEENNKKPFSAIEGVWVVESITSIGVDIPKEKILHEYHFQSPDQLIRKGIKVGTSTGRDRKETVKLDNSKDPAQMDLSRTFRGKLRTVRAIYKIEGDRLTICFQRGRNRQPSSKRPKDFESSKKNQSDLLVLKRKKPTGS